MSSKSCAACAAPNAKTNHRSQRSAIDTRGEAIRWLICIRINERKTAAMMK